MVERRQRQWVRAARLLKEGVSLPGMWDDLKAWCPLLASGIATVGLVFGQVRAWLLDGINALLAMETIGTWGPIATVFLALVVVLRGAWKRGKALASGGPPQQQGEGHQHHDVLWYVAVRTGDPVFGSSDFMEPKSSASSKTERAIIPRCKGAAYVAFATPAFLADPTHVDPDDQGMNQFSSFEALPGTFNISGRHYKAWRSVHQWDDLASGMVLVIKLPTIEPLI